MIHATSAVMSTAGAWWFVAALLVVLLGAAWATWYWDLP